MYEGQKFLRGQVWWVGNSNKDYSSGSVQSDNRPCVIVSNNTGNLFSPILTVLPCTTADKKDLPTHISVKINNTQSVILCEQVKTVNKTDAKSYMFTLSDDLMTDVDKSLKITLGLESGTYKEQVIQDTDDTTNTELHTINETSNECEVKYRKWTYEDKLNFVNYVESFGIKDTSIKYNTGFNTKLYYKRFCKYLNREEMKV